MSFEKLVDMYKDDGKDHVRIHHRGKTKVGRLLSVNARIPFTVEGAGKFTSPQCFVYWLISGNEQARHDIKFKPPEYVKEFFDYMLYAKYLQLKDHFKDLDKFFIKDVPYVMYKIHSTGVREVYDWNHFTSKILTIIEGLREEVKGNSFNYSWRNSINNKVRERILEIGRLQSSTEQVTETNNIETNEEETND